MRVSTDLDCISGSLAGVFVSMVPVVAHQQPTTVDAAAMGVSADPDLLLVCAIVAWHVCRIDACCLG